MEAWMAFVSIIAIVAIVLVAGGLIAFIGHMIIGAFDHDKKESKEVIDYSNIKQLESPKVEEKVVTEDYDFESINEAKAEEEKKMLEKEIDIDVFKLEALENDEDLEALEARLKAANEQNQEEQEIVEEVEELQSEEVSETAVENISEDADDFDLDSILDEIANDVIEEEKEILDLEQPSVVMDETLQNYNIDDYLKETEETVEEVTEETNEKSENFEELDLEELERLDKIADEQEEDDSEDEDEGEEVELDLTEEKVEEVEEAEEELSEEDKAKEIESLKAQLAELNKKLEEARSGKVEVVSIDMTEEECVARLELLEERLKNAKREYKINMKEFKPLRKVMNDLDKYQTKLRRKETIVAKKKVALYGVNNYVDIDKEKAEKLANELELLDGLRLSVNHCEEVINANKDRYPILEHTNRILEDQISHLEADIASTSATLEKIREKNNK